MSYTPETEFMVTEDNMLVYTLKRDDKERAPKSRMVSDVRIPINAPAEHRAEIA